MMCCVLRLSVPSIPVGFVLREADNIEGWAVKISLGSAQSAVTFYEDVNLIDNATGDISSGINNNLCQK